MKNKEIGYAGEKIVADLLEQRGCEILCRNFTIKGGEIDIIAKQGDYVLFIEVKTRKKGSMVSGVEAITPSKKKFIIKTAEEYLYRTGCDLQPRFDVVSVELDKDRISDIIYIDNAFDLSD